MAKGTMDEASVIRDLSDLRQDQVDELDMIIAEYRSESDLELGALVVNLEELEGGFDLDIEGDVWQNLSHIDQLRLLKDWIEGLQALHDATASGELDVHMDNEMSLFIKAD